MKTTPDKPDWPASPATAPGSIRRTILVTLCAAAAMLLPLGGCAVYWVIQGRLEAQFDALLNARARALVAASEFDDGKFEIDDDVQDFAGFTPVSAKSRSSHTDYFEVTSESGATLARSPSMGATDLHLLRDAFTQLPRQPGAHPHANLPVHARFGPLALPDGRPGRAVWITYIPKADDNHLAGRVQLVVASYSGELASSLHTIAWVLAASGALGVIVSLGIVSLTLRRGLEPLDTLATQVQAIDTKRLEQRLPTSGLPAELQIFAGKLNEMLERVAAAFARERRFSSHAAHELRTPLAELKAMTELIARWPEELTPQHGAEMLRVIGELELLLSKLSLLSRADAGPTTTAALEPVDLAASVMTCVEKHLPEANAKGMTIQIELEKPTSEDLSPTVLTDPVLWNAILHNLIGNAVSHAPHGSTITLKATRELLAVSNPAADLVEEDMELLFERFWRKHPHVEATDGRHSGLGLSIVYACAAALDKTCTASLKRGILSVTVLPTGKSRYIAGKSKNGF